MSSIRRIAATSALALAASGLGVVAAQPATAADDGTLTWSFSDYLFNAGGQSIGFTSRTAADGAEATATDVVFSGGTGTGSLETGDLDVAYTGSVTFTWHVDITFSDPEVVVEGDEGRIVADVAWKLPETGALEDVVLTTFDPATATVDGTAFSATPDWTSGAWAPEFVSAIPTSIQGFFKASGSSSDARKAPARFTASTVSAAAVPAVTLTPEYADGAVTVDVVGTGFAPVFDPATRLDGVYTALAPSGQFPETDDFEDQEKVAATTWLPQAAITDGRWVTTLIPQNQYLDPRKSYSVYTWQAHNHTNAASDTETPVTIDFSQLGTVAKIKAVKKGKKLVVTVGDETAAGKVAAKLTKGKKSKKASAKVVEGVATLALPKPKGKWKVALTYTSTNAAYRSAKKTVTVRVR